MEEEREDYRTLLLDGRYLSSVVEFFDANPDLTPEERAEVEALRVGETVALGGGGGAYTVKRLQDMENPFGA